MQERQGTEEAPEKQGTKEAKEKGTWKIREVSVRLKRVEYFVQHLDSSREGDKEKEVEVTDKTTAAVPRTKDKTDVSKEKIDNSKFNRV